jgi:hypothetical protein
MSKNISLILICRRYTAPSDRVKSGRPNRRRPDSPFPQKLTHHERMISDLYSKPDQTPLRISAYSQEVTSSPLRKVIMRCTIEKSKNQSQMTCNLDG